MTNKEAGRAVFAENTDVSRETLEKLDVYAALLKKWNPTINLVGRSTLPDLWGRHFLDSAQLFDLAKQKSGHWVDIGSGGGFPGLVVAVISAEKAPDYRFTFIESDVRKTVFLQTVARELSLPVTVLAERVEKVAPLGADILSARALAPLTTLLGYAERHLSPGGQALLMKGATFRRELDDVLEFWTFQSQECTSITDGAAVILNIGDIRRV